MGFKVLTVALLDIQVFWGVILYQASSSDVLNVCSASFLGLSTPRTVWVRWAVNCWQEKELICFVSRHNHL